MQTHVAEFMDAANTVDPKCKWNLIQGCLSRKSMGMCRYIQWAAVSNNLLPHFLPQYFTCLKWHTVCYMSIDWQSAAGERRYAVFKPCFKTAMCASNFSAETSSSKCRSAERLHLHSQRAILKFELRGSPDPAITGVTTWPITPSRLLTRHLWKQCRSIHRAKSQNHCDLTGRISLYEARPASNI